MSEPVHLSLHRGVSHSELSSTDVDISVPPGSTLLDALIALRESGDDIAFDYSCVTNNSCKLCNVRVDGVPVYACTFVVKAGRRYSVDPIDLARTHRDLFINRTDLW